jgi:hypothetical protein
MISNERRGHFLLSSVILRYHPYISVQNVEDAKKKRAARKKGRETLRLRRGLIKGVEGKKGGKPSTPGGGITYDALSSGPLRDSRKSSFFSFKELLSITVFL